MSCILISDWSDRQPFFFIWMDALTIELSSHDLFCISDLNFSEPHILSRRFYLLLYEFSRLDLINFDLQDLNFLLIAICLIEIDIATNRFARFYETRPKQLLCWSKQRFLRPYCNLLWSFFSIAWKWINFIIFNFLHIIASRKNRQIFPDFISGRNLSLTRVHLVLI